MEIKKDEFGPEYVVNIYDPELKMEGFLVCGGLAKLKAARSLSLLSFGSIGLSPVSPTIYRKAKAGASGPQNHS